MKTYGSRRRIIPIKNGSEIFYIFTRPPFGRCGCRSMGLMRVDGLEDQFGGRNVVDR